MVIWKLSVLEVLQHKLGIQRSINLVYFRQGTSIFLHYLLFV